MTDSRFPTLAAAIDHMTPRQRHITALAFSESTQPLLHALALELMRANLTEERDLARLEADYHRQDAEDRAAAGIDALARIAALPLDSAAIEDLEALEVATLASEQAVAAAEQAERRAAVADQALKDGEPPTG